MMGLAPYGKPTYVDQLERVIRPLSGGRFELDLQYFRHHSEGVEMTWDEGSPELGKVYSDGLSELLGPARDPEDPEFFGKWADIAHSAQIVYERIFFHVLDDLHERTKMTRLAMAGGCALNSVANGKIFEKTPFKEVFIQPAAGDNGTSIGAAFYVEHAVLRGARQFVMEHAYTGPSFSRRRDPGSHRRRAGRRLGSQHRRGSSRGRGACSATSPRRWPTAASWGGSRAAWSSARARSAIGRSSPTRVAPT